MIARVKDLERRHRGIAKQIGVLKEKQKEIEKALRRMFLIGFISGAIFSIASSIIIEILLRMWGL